MRFSLVASEYAAGPIPTLQDWESVWNVWDVVTRGMLPQEDLLEKPIKLRNACIFYLGHIPAFLDIQLCKTTGGPPTEPGGYHAIFERGIDPDVDNPENCHAHSEIPDEWPPLNDILRYQSDVRTRVRGLYDATEGGSTLPHHVARAVFVGFEHELMHIETLLYMMLQSDRILPPPNVVPPDFGALAEESRKRRVENEWFRIPAQKIVVGMNEAVDLSTRRGHFGW